MIGALFGLYYSAVIVSVLMLGIVVIILISSIIDWKKGRGK